MIGRSYLEVDGSVNSAAIKGMPFILGIEGFALTSINLKFSFSAVIISLKFYTYIFFLYFIYLSECVTDGYFVIKCNNTKLVASSQVCYYTSWTNST